MKILIAEDDPVSKLLLKRTLERLGHEVTSAGNGEEAWSLFERDEHPLIISDWMMPELDGLELCQRIRTAPTNAYPYFVLLTARSSRGDRLAAMECGVDDFLAKPLDKAELEARLRTVDRILSWQAQLQEVNKSLLASTHLIAEKVGEIQRMRELADYLAAHDSLTDLLNRRAWIETASAMQPSAVAIYDIDFFKAVNDVYGHPGGDQVLRFVGEVISRAAGPEASVGRLGGEEFGVFFRGNVRDAEERAREIIVAVAEEAIPLDDGRSVNVTVSGGFTPWLALAGDFERGVQRNYDAADRALYQAKESGRERLVVSNAS